jgi:ribonuclease P protein component
MGKTLGLGRERRIKQGRDFLRIRSEGKRFSCGCLIANWASAAGPRSRIGVITGRKMGNAVARARARRLLREAFRVHQAELLNAVDLVLVARPSIVGKGFSEVERDLLEAFRKGRLLKQPV